MTNENTIYTIGNISTIATWISLTITVILSYFGVVIDQATLLPVVSGLITIIIAIWSSKNPNTFAFLGNQPHTNTCECNDETDLNPEYYKTMSDEDGA